jgi:hypothetical protein
MIGRSTLAQLPFLRDYESRRASSWDQTGGNEDWWTLEAGARKDLLVTDGPGCIKHIWMTVGGDDSYPRKLVLRMWWDGEPEPSVEVPLGDFFGIGHGLRRNFASLPLQMSPEDGRAFNCWWPMPFDSARVEIHNECSVPVNVYFYIDYEEYPGRDDWREPGERGEDAGDDRDELANGPLSVSSPYSPSSPSSPSSFESHSSPPHSSQNRPARFHAQWRREAATEGFLTEKLNDENHRRIWRETANTSDKDNYLLLEAEGDGIYVGCNLNIDCFSRQGNDWYGEGDDMIVIDSEPWPPRLHGTGTEDYFNTAFGPTQEFSAPYHGITVNSGNPDWRWKGKNSMYRFHIEDPIRFRKSIRVSIEHGHGNKLTNDYSSTAYWYQHEPHKPFPKLLPVEERLPRPNEPGFP